MFRSPGTPMDGTEITEYLDSHFRGVLCFGSEGGGHGVPVSFAYDSDSRDLYVRVMGDPSVGEIGMFGGDTRASIVSYDDRDGYEAVVAEGRLETVAESSIDSTVRQSVHELKVPSPNAAESVADDEEARLARLTVERVSGHREGVANAGVTGGRS